MTERREAVAMALCAAEFNEVGADYAWNVQDDAGMELYRRQADAAIAAMDKRDIDDESTVVLTAEDPEYPDTMRDNDGVIWGIVRCEAKECHFYDDFCLTQGRTPNGYPGPASYVVHGVAICEMCHEGDDFESRGITYKRSDDEWNACAAALGSEQEAK